jgi:hypothetical protein
LNSKRPIRIRAGQRRRAGFALLLAIIVLVVLSSVAAGLSLRLTMAKRRQQYMIEYQRARYGLDSAIKYVLSDMPVRTFKLEPRTDAPDFSDLFWMTDSAYAQFINAWLATATDEQIEAVLKEEDQTQTAGLSNKDLTSWLASLFGGDNASPDPNALDALNPDGSEIVEIDPNAIEVPGPYGVPWPYVCEPIELTIGTARITITIEDENAKMPLSWLVTNFKQTNEQAEHSLKTFGAWMQMTPDEIKQLQASLEDIYKQKMFRVNPNPILLQNKPAAPTAQAAQFSRRTHTRTAPGQRTPATASNTPQPAGTQQRPASAHATDFAKLFHSSMLNHEILMRPLPGTAKRVENAYKYLSLWGAQRININTAPRHILEAAFMLTLDAFEAPKLAQQVIEIRKEKPFTKIEELKDVGMLDTDSFNNLKNYIAVSSNFFKVRVTSSSGNASANAVATVIKEGKNVETLAVMYGF